MMYLNNCVVFTCILTVCIDINKVVCKGQSPTHIAVLSKNFEAFLYLITQPSWTDSKNSQGKLFIA
jgi:hypothetical protein